MLTLINNNLWIDLEDVSWFRLNYLENEFSICLKNDPCFKLKNVEEAKDFMIAWESFLIETGECRKYKYHSSHLS